MAEEKIQGISGIGVFAAFVGGIFLYASVKGFSIAQTVQAIVAGKNPQSLTVTEPVTPGGLFSSLFSGPSIGSFFSHLLSAPGGPGASAGGSGSTASVTSGPGANSFAAAVLHGIGAPATSANINSILAWIHREGGGGANNPLNTTLRMPGSTSFNSVGVQNFSNMSIGATATVRTLLGGGYGDVLSALHSGQGLCGRSFSGLSRWSGGGYSSVC